MKTTILLTACSALLLTACSDNQQTTTDHCPTPAEIKANQNSTVNGWVLYVHNKKAKTKNLNTVSSKLASNAQFKWLQKHVKKVWLSHWAPDTTRFVKSAVCGYKGGANGNNVFFYGKNIKLKKNPNPKYWRKDKDLMHYPKMYLCWPTKNDPTPGIKNCYFQ